MNNYIFNDYVDPEYIARKLKDDFSIDESKPINLDNLLKDLNIILKYREISPKILGSCKSVGLKRLILINPNVKNDGRRRFTAAHEIGHIILHHGSQCCTVDDLNLYFTYNDREKQANSFAAELLLPKFPLKKILRDTELTIELVENVAKKYSASFIATSIRLVTLSDEPVAIFYHKDGKIDWGIKSPECMYEIKRNMIEFSSIASNFNKTKRINKGYVDITSWFDSSNYSANCFEETIYFNNLDSFLTIAKIEDYGY